MFGATSDSTIAVLRRDPAMHTCGPRAGISIRKFKIDGNRIAIITINRIAIITINRKAIITINRSLKSQKRCLCSQCSHAHTCRPQAGIGDGCPHAFGNALRSVLVIPTRTLQIEGLKSQKRCLCSQF